AVAKLDQISEVGFPAAELPDAQRPNDPFQTLPQIRFEPRRIEALVRPLVNQLGRFEVYRISRLHWRSASFETRAAPAPQDEEDVRWHEQKSLILSAREASSRRTQRCSSYLAQLQPSDREPQHLV